MRGAAELRVLLFVPLQDVLARRCVRHPTRLLLVQARGPERGMSSTASSSSFGSSVMTVSRITGPWELSLTLKSSVGRTSQVLPKFDEMSEKIMPSGSVDKMMACKWSGGKVLTLGQDGVCCACPATNHQTKRCGRQT